MPLYLGLGSNLGDRRATLRRALRLLAGRLTVVGVSGLYETEPVGSPARVALRAKRRRKTKDDQPSDTKAKEEETGDKAEKPAKPATKPGPATDT